MAALWVAANPALHNKADDIWKQVRTTFFTTDFLLDVVAPQLGKTGKHAELATILAYYAMSPERRREVKDGPRPRHGLKPSITTRQRFRMTVSHVATLDKPLSGRFYVDGYQYCLCADRHAGGLSLFLSSPGTSRQAVQIEMGIIPPNPPSRQIPLFTMTAVFRRPAERSFGSRNLLNRPLTELVHGQCDYVSSAGELVIYAVVEPLQQPVA